VITDTREVKASFSTNGDANGRLSTIEVGRMAGNMIPAVHGPSRAIRGHDYDGRVSITLAATRARTRVLTFFVLIFAGWQAFDAQTGESSPPKTRAANEKDVKKLPELVLQGPVAAPQASLR
jgi:hypothetical protein